MSTQSPSPYGTVEQTQAETTRLLEMGKQGGYIFVPTHDVEEEFPLENILAFIDII